MFTIILFLPFIGFLFIVLFARFIPVVVSLYINICGLIVAITMTFFLSYDVSVQGASTIVLFGSWIDVGLFHVEWSLLYDSLSVIMVLLVLIISTFVHYYSWEYMGSDPHFLRFLSYLSIFTFFMLVFVTSGNFLQMFLGWEGVGLSSYLLINFWYTRLQANKSAMKAIVVNRISDFFLYFSLFIIFFIYGTLDYTTIFNVVGFLQIHDFWLQILMFCIFIGAVGKSAQLGLHTWLPDAMEGPTPVSALLHAATMVTAGVYLLIRCSPILEFTPTILLWIIFIGGLTTFFAGTIGCFQNDIKKIIAYSTCSQLGYMFLVCGLGQFNVSFFHLFNHAFFKALLFLGAGSVIHALLDEQDIRRMGGLFKSLPLTFITFIIGSLALTGVPYLTGFYSKDLLIELAFATYLIPSIFVYWLALCSVFFTAFYSTRLIFYVFLTWPNYQTFFIKESGGIILSILSLLALFSLFIGFLSKEFFVGVGSSIWQVAINLLCNTVFFDAELSFTFGGIYFFNKLLPFWITILASLSAIVVLKNWEFLINFFVFRRVYEFINQRWYFDVIYLHFITIPIMYVGYSLTFKLLDRGVLEAFGGVMLLNKLLNIVACGRAILESGQFYTYLVMQLLFLFILQLFSFL